MHQDPTLPILTERLVLRRFSNSDFSAFAAYRARKEVYRYLYAAPPQGEALREKFDRARVATFAQDGDMFKLAVARKDDGVLVGEVSLKLESKAALQGEVGYVFNPDYGGRGYATEAVEAMIDLGFSAFGFHRIFARLDTQNTGSIGVVERLGLRREAHLIENDRFDGVWGDEYIYAILAREWVARRA